MSGTGSVSVAASVPPSGSEKAGRSASSNQGTHGSLPHPEQQSNHVRGVSTPGSHGRSQSREDNRHAIRRRSMDIVAEANGDVQAFVQEMDQKRKMLDEQIHKFIAQKEREFKRYEQEMRKKYQTPQVSADLQVAPTLGSEQQTKLEQEVSREFIEDTRTAPTIENLRSRVDRRTANSGLEDVRPSYEREKDFMGLFTPSFLPLLDGKPELNRSPSAPSLSENYASEPLQPDRTVLQRANTEPLFDAGGNQRPRFGQRTPSSSSEGLVSVLKTSGGRKNPKPMRVMLQLADDQPAVHPNDDLPTERDYAPVRQAEAQHHSKQPEPNRFASEEPSPTPSPSLAPKSPDLPQVNDSPMIQKHSSLTQGLASRYGAPPAMNAPGSLSNGNNVDLDDFASPFPLDEEVEEPRGLEPDWEVDFEEDIDQDPRVSRSPSLVESPELSGSPLNASSLSDNMGSLDTRGLQIRSSSSSSGQPISPGFSRPSVREDPILSFDTPEINDAVDPVGQGSLYDAFTRPSYSSRGAMSGSLGESYMQRNAEKMMRHRRS